MPYPASHARSLARRGADRVAATCRPERLRIDRNAFIAFSVANRIRAGDNLRSAQTLGNDDMSPLFEAVVEATEESIYNSLFKATTVTGRDGHRVEALPTEKTVEILKKYGAAK